MPQNRSQYIFLRRVRDRQDDVMGRERPASRRTRLDDDPFHTLREEQFFSRFRFRKDTVKNIIYPLLRDVLEIPDGRGLPISPMLKLLAVLRFYATGSFQGVCGDLTSISQPTVSRLVARVSERFAQLVGLYVQFPQGQAVSKTKQAFKNMHGFPGVVGCIDCTHVEITKPRGVINAETFRNRKGKLSINVQVICGPDTKIYDIVARWPGSAHDSRIFDSSSAKMKFETGAVQGILLGDGGYAQTDYLFTPLLNPRTEAEERYNAAQIRTRQTVERLFGILKRRFPCLSKTLATNVTTTLRIIIACSVLHNIGIMSGDVNTEHYSSTDAEIYEETETPFHPPALQRRGAQIKADFIARHFS